MKIVINTCFGGFGLSYEGHFEYAKNAGITLYAEELKWPLGSFVYYTKPKDQRAGGWDSYFNDRNIQRDDPHLVSTIEKLGKAAGGQYSELAIVDIPDDVKWEIENYDGNETVAEQHQVWR